MTILTTHHLESILRNKRNELRDQLPVGIYFEITVDLPGPGHAEALWRAQAEVPRSPFKMILHMIGMWFIKKSLRT